MSFSGSFVPALTHQLKWSVGDNKYYDPNKGGDQPKAMSLFIPEESILELATYLQKLASNSDKLKPGSVYDFETKEKIEVRGFYINGKGNESNDGAYGSINLAQIKETASAPQGWKPPTLSNITPPLQPTTDDIPF